MTSLPEWMNRFIFIAHRGASAYEPENTLRSFKRAIEMGADAIEFDVRITKDGSAVVIHDEDLKRVASADAKVRELTVSELKRYLVYGTEPIPTLEEVLDEIGGKLPLFIEIKDIEVTSKVVSELKKRGLINEAIVISFHEEALRIARSEDSSILTGLISARRNIGIRDIVKHRVNAFLPRHDVVTPRLVRECHAHGLRVYAWTVNDPSIAMKMISYGVNGIATDKPDLKRSVSKQQTLLKYLKP
ncbi:MAG: glycerophosphodiester phosphodiesterase [Crenarchaeota archaeon]|nr:glycerophosphodiester phosphodiesterase [Thermoproteota archaeon]